MGSEIRPEVLTATVTLGPLAILSPEAAKEDRIRIFSQATWWQAGKLTREEGLC